MPVAGGPVGTGTGAAPLARYGRPAPKISAGQIRMSLILRGRRPCRDRCAIWLPAQRTPHQGIGPPAAAVPAAGQRSGQAPAAAFFRCRRCRCVVCRGTRSRCVPRQIRRLQHLPQAVPGLAGAEPVLHDPTEIGHPRRRHPIPHRIRSDRDEPHAPSSADPRPSCTGARKRCRFTLV